VKRIAVANAVAARDRLDDGLGPAVEEHPVLGRHAEIMRHHEARQRLEQVGDDVRLALRPHRLDALGDEATDGRFDRGDLARREVLGDQAPERRMFGRVQEHHRHGLAHAGRVHVAIDDRQPAGRRERGRIAGGRPDVVEARENVEIAAGHVVHGVLVPKDGVRTERIPPTLAAA
jgi:hypothetical protein